MDPAVALTQSPYSYANDDPINGDDPLGLWGWNPISDVTQGWNDTGGKVVSAVSQHWRGIAQVAVTVTAGLATGLCIAATDGACAVLAPAIGCGVGSLNSLIGGGSGKDIALGCGEGGLVGSAALLCVAGLCGPVAAAWAVDLAIGGAQGDWDYAHSGGCHTAWGYVKAFGSGAFNNAPIPWDKVFGGAGDG